jgi:hypothetical protein
MKLVVRLVAPLVAVLVTGVAAVAVAAPAPDAKLRKVYPDVAADASVCVKEKTAMDVAALDYNFLVGEWQRDVALNRKKSLSDEDLRKSARRMYEAGITLIEARYAEAQCRLKAGNDGKKVCKALVLDLHAMLDELPLYQELLTLAEADWNAVKDKANVPEADRKLAEKNYEVAKRRLKGAEDFIAAQRKAIANNAACQGFPVERPVEDKPVQPAPPDDPGDDTPGHPLPTATVAPPLPAQP